MPTERFLNLPGEKRERILNAALAELARVPFDALSINRIVQGAGIARGSFYQYFADKNDLLEYIMQGYKDTMQQVARQSFAQNGGDLFEVFADILRFTIEFGSQEQRYEVLKNVFVAARQSTRAAFGFFKLEPCAMVDKYLPRVNTAHYRDPSPQGLARLIEALSVLLINAIGRAFDDLPASGAVARDFCITMETMKYGALKAEEK